MNREIKFRAWDKSFNRYTEREFLISSCHKNTIEVVGVSLDENVDDLNEDIVLEQYTGLKDKNGVEIYEGDIVNHIIKPRIKGKISFFEGSFIIGTAICANSLINFNAPKYFEVIGNIHQNPELI